MARSSGVYKTINGVPLEDYLAHTVGVKNAVAEESVRVAAIAKSILASTDHPKGVRVTQGARDGLVDSYVYLVGPSGAVDAFEFGRNPFVTPRTIFMGPDEKYPQGRFVPPGTLIKGFRGKHVLRKTWESA